ncbi:hypothetical protein HYE67_007867 [Fusarium culmorum]|nr:hypothetical protein HYE67_007867 [Fusarium culmorum]
MSSATDSLSTTGTESIISQATDTTTLTARETVSSSVISIDTSATSSETAISSSTEAQLTLSTTPGTAPTGRETQSSHTAISDTTTTASGDLTTTTLTPSFTYTTEVISSYTTITSSEMDTSATTTLGDSATSTTETSSTDTTVTTTRVDTSGTTTLGEPTSTVTDTITSTTETGSTDATTASETSATSSETTTATSTDATTTATTAFSSTTEATSTTSETSSGAVPVCTPGFPISPAPQGLECDKKSQTSGHENIISWDTDALTKSIDICYNACRKTPNCGDIVFWKDVACELWKGKPGQTDGAPTTHGWYDMKCFCGEEPTEPEPTCTNNLKSPAPANKICGKNGYVGRTFTGQGAADSLKACAKLCKSNNSCTSFVFEANIVCFLFSGTLEATDGQPLSWVSYDWDCFCDLDKPDPEPEPQCVNGAKEPAPKDTVCGVRVSSKGPMEKVDDWDSDTTTLEDCRDECWALGTCESFTFESSEGCIQYKSHVSTTGVDEAQDGKVWYDVSCFCPPEEEPEPVCVDDSPKDKICGVQGRPGNQCLYQLFSARIASFEECKEKCKTNHCDSFSFREDGGLCETYQGRVGGTEDFKSPWKWYDAACFNDENTSTEPQPICKNNIVSPIPEEMICGEKGRGGGV